MIVVTGSDGIIGRELCKQMQGMAIAFMPVTHRQKPHTSDNALIVDLATDIDLLQKYCPEIKAIVHLAAAVPHSIYYPDNDESANQTRQIDRNIFELQRQTNVPVIYMSTCGLYDRSTSLLKHADERTQLKISTPYFAAKASGEKLFSDEGMSTILRLAAPVGTGLKPQLVLSRFISTARNNKAISIWGSGTREQDFIDTADIANLIIKILEQPKRATINVASSKPITMLKLAEKIVSVIGSGSIEMSGQSDPRDGENARYSIEKAEKLYGWMPAHTIEQSVEKIASEDFEINK
jgi:nucleoside-diphosphate-sugar epimerase